MAITEYDTITKELAEGRASTTLRDRATYSQGQRADLPNFYRYVVLDVVFDPTIIDAKKLDYWEHELGVANIKHASVAPRNAIIARRITTNAAAAGEPTLVLYPFFPPNLSMPCQCGEHVWVMFEDPNSKNDLGYWFCRIVTANHAEDVNHTHPHRAHDPSFVPTIKDVFDGNDQPRYEFRNGEPGDSNGERYTIPTTSTAPGGEDAYKHLMTETDAGRVTHHESVPRYRKRPGDVVLEGSNNALIVVGRDRNGPVATYEDDPVRGKLPKVPLGDVQDDGAAAIDLVVGRGQTTVTGGTSVKNAIDATEIGKSTKELSDREGDPDFSTDRSRVLIAQQTMIDENFDLTTFNKDFDTGSIQGSASDRTSITDDQTTKNGDGGVVIKTDKIRFIARSDVEILVTTFTRDANGKMVTVEDKSKWAAFVIKTNGDIVFKPADQGFIKLGGDDASNPLLIGDVAAEVVDGVVISPPLISTMGGQIGGAKRTGTNKNDTTLAPGQGKWAAKILCK